MCHCQSVSVSLFCLFHCVFLSLPSLFMSGLVLVFGWLSDCLCSVIVCLVRYLSFIWFSNCYCLVQQLSLTASLSVFVCFSICLCLLRHPSSSVCFSTRLYMLFCVLQYLSTTFQDCPYCITIRDMPRCVVVLVCLAGCLCAYRSQALVIFPLPGANAISGHLVKFDRGN